MAHVRVPNLPKYPGATAGQAAPPPQQPPTGAGGPPAGGPPSSTTPPPPTQPTPLGKNLLGLGPLKTGLTRAQNIMNIVRRTVRRVASSAPVAEDNAIIQPLLDERARAYRAAENRASVLASKATETVRRAFKTDKNGGVQALAGIDPTVPGAPTIQDIAARYPTYEPHLTTEQRAAMGTLRQEVGPYRDLLNQVGVTGIGSRADVMPGGFYLPRGGADPSGFDTPLKIRAGRTGAGKPGFAKPATFASQAEGIAAGYEYSPLGDALRVYAREAGRKATNVHIANYLRSITDATGATFAEALDPVTGVGRDRGIINLPGVEQQTFPDVMANAANKIIRQEGEAMGAFSPVARVLAAYNSLYRGFRATLDNSAPLIQGLLGLGSDAPAYRKALWANIRAWGDKNVHGKFIVDYDQRAARTGRLDSGRWAQAGLRVGGADTEFALGHGSWVGRIFGFKQANRAFGMFGDGLRLEWADTMLEVEMAMGRTLDEIEQAGDLARIALEANQMTGHATKRFGGHVGDLLLFAPRFLQARLETLTKAALSLRPGAPLDQRLARKAVLRTAAMGFALTYTINKLQGQETDVRPIVDGKWNPNFMRVRAFGRDWSLFGTYDSLLRAIVLTGQGRPFDVASGMASGVLGTSNMVYQLFTNKGFMGKPTRDTPEQFAAHILESLAPFSLTQGLGNVAGMAKAVGTKDVGSALMSGTGLVGDILAFKSSPLSFSDVKDIISFRNFDKPYKNLDTAERRAVNEDPDMKERVAGFGASDAGTPRQQYSKAHADYQRGKTQYETDLRGKIAAGMKGKALRDAIQDFKRDRFTASDLIFNDPVVAAQAKRDAKSLRDTFADRYWSVPLGEDSATGRLFFDQQKVLRQVILDEAKAAGVDTKYITETGDTSYRGNRFTDPVVRASVEDYERDMEALRPYWEITPPGPNLGRVWEEYQNSSAPEQALMKRGSKGNVIRAMDRYVSQKREELRRQNPEIGKLLYKWGYLSGTNFQSVDELRAFREQVGGVAAPTPTPRRENRPVRVPLAGAR